MNYFELDEGKNQTIFAKTSLSTIKLLTYNLFLRPPGIKTNKNDYKNERLEEFFKIMGNYDIICLQEVFATFSSRKERLLKKAIKHGFYFIESSPDPSFFSFYVIDGGLVVLSKFPIISSEFCFFKYSDFPDSLTFRGGLYNKIEVFGETLHLFTGHTQATYLGNEAGMKKNIITRIRQFLEVSVFVDKCLTKNEFQEDHVALFLADFNVDANQGKYPLHFISSFEKKELLKTNNDFFYEYETLLKILSVGSKYIVLDLLRNNYNGRSPPTYGESIEDGEGKLIPMETVLTGIEDLNTNHCLDYFLQFIPNTGINIHELEKKFFVDEKSIKIEKFLIEGRLFTQLSDHYGVSGNLKVKTKGERDEKPLLTLEITKGILN